MKNLIQLTCLLLLTAGLCAQPEDYLFSHVGVTSGLSNNHVTSIYKDNRGFMWFGTVSGLNRYDGYVFRVFKHDSHDPHSIADNFIEQIFEGPGGRMWVESRKGRFNIYDPDLDRFDLDFGGWLRGHGLPASQLQTVVSSGSTVSRDYWFVYRDSGVYHYMADGKVAGCALGGSPAVTAGVDGKGDCWVLHDNGRLEKIDWRSNRVVFQSDVMVSSFGDVPVTTSHLFIDGQGDLWITSLGVFKGVLWYHPSTNSFRQLAQDAGEHRLNSNIGLSALQDRRGMIWMATDHGGINIIDKRDGSVKFIGHTEDDYKSLSENSVTSLYADNLGTVWVGTYKSGINYYQQNNLQFPQYRHEPGQPGSLSYDDINGFVEDAAGNLWLAGNGGGLIYFDRKKHSFRQYLHDSHDPNSLSSNILVSLLLDRDGKLWIGTYFGGLDCFDGKRFIHYRHRDNDPGSLADDRIMCLCEDSDRRLWIGTLAAGMDMLDRHRKVFKHYRSSLPNSIHNDYVSSIITDSKDNLWIATGYGIDKIDKQTGVVGHYSVDYNHLSSDNVTWLFIDSRQRLWAGTREGLDVLDEKGQFFQAFTTEDGLPDNMIRYIQEDARHRIWVSTPNGLSRITVSFVKDKLRIRCRNFHEQDGLQGREFNERAGLATRDGYMLFGGPNGFNMFRPDDVAPDLKTPPIVLTGLEVFDKSVHVGDSYGGHVILEKALTETKTIRLTYKENMFSIEFASLGFIPNANNKYAYTLDGFNTKWLTTDGRTRKATYTNLDPGEYVFHVRATDDDGEWYDRTASLRIIILPPWWKTPVAYFVYFVLLIAVLVVARWMVIRRARLRFALENERRETRRMHEMDLMKIRFFTNMSHELRTPLSLILAPVEKLLGRPGAVEPRQQYEMIRRNARRLLHLVNQLLDFRKMEVNELKLHLREGDVLRFIQETSLSFVDLADRKNIAFSFESNRQSLITRFDHDKLERILFNLLSNAFKFTPENGAVRVYVDTAALGEDVMVSIRIVDTGIGIAAEKLEKIFERFFQSEVPDNILNQGSGIGLAITQEFVRMHNGMLAVDSELNKGSTFTVELPFRELTGVGVSADPVEVPILPAPVAVAPPAAPPGAPTLLIVEDNEDFRFYLKDNLRTFYKIVEASDGKEGWKKVLSAHPDLVVSDISMPHMDGIELCRKIRNDDRTKQIPVILLTAMTGEQVELQGLQTGATDYISKPFNFEVLQSKIRNIVAYKETVRKTYQRQVQAGPASVEPVSADDIFIKEVLQYIEKEMSNPELSVAELSTQFHSSRSTFYKRLLLLTGKTPVELIRHIRLKRAAELLEKSTMTVAEVAYTVGFNNPKYFTQFFKAEFGCIPSAYRSNKAAPPPAG